MHMLQWIRVHKREACKNRLRWLRGNIERRPPTKILRHLDCTRRGSVQPILTGEKAIKRDVK
uniref:Uncharacterized protein n=1 Tax=Arundo donax TaxID=35708 RepID=A0A0A9F057_ARUDO